MDLMGPSLQDYTNSEQATNAVLLKAFYNATKDLEFVHSKRIIHRDIKLGNICLGNVFPLDGSGSKLIDYGESAITNSIEHDLIVGTKPYMSPEISRFLEPNSNSYNSQRFPTAGQVSGETKGKEPVPYSTKSDIWALTTVLFSLMYFEVSKERMDKCGTIYLYQRFYNQDTKLNYFNHLDDDVIQRHLDFYSKDRVKSVKDPRFSSHVIENSFYKIDGLQEILEKGFIKDPKDRITLDEMLAILEEKSIPYMQRELHK
jgi:serine/threonine protein kinase